MSSFQEFKQKTMDRMGERYFKKQKVFYVIQQANGHNYLVDKKFLQLFLTQKYFQSVETLADTNYAIRRGAYVGKSGTPYEMITVNGKGLLKYFVEGTHAEGESFLEALYEMDTHKNPNHLPKEKVLITFNFEKNNIQRIYASRAVNFSKQESSQEEQAKVM